MNYAEPASQREITDGRERARTSRRGGGVVKLPPGFTFTSDRDIALARVADLLDSDSFAATIVAATINTRQAAGESGPAFVKRIVRSWLAEMARVRS